MLNIIRPLSLGTEGLAGALCATTKTKERRRAGEGEGERSPEQVGFGSRGSKADPLRKARRGLGATGGAGFPCGDLGRGRTLDSASRVGLLAPRLLQVSGSFLKALQLVCSPLLDSDHRTRENPPTIPV